MALKTSTKAGAGFGAAVLAAAVIFTPTWEGTDLVAKRDMIGTGNPITYCNGLTSHDGAVTVGQKFTKEQCAKLLAPALAKYWKNIEPCIKVAIPVKVGASLLDAGFNAGESAVCKSPMLKKINAGDIRGGCLAFEGWYVTTKNNGVRKVIPGLEKRRKGDYRKGEKQLCLEGWVDGVEKPKPLTFWTKVKLFFSAILKGN